MFVCLCGRAAGSRHEARRVSENSFGVCVSAVELRAPGMRHGGTCTRGAASAGAPT